MSQSLLGSNTFNHMSEFVFRRARPHWAESYPPALLRLFELTRFFSVVVVAVVNKVLTCLHNSGD